MNGCDTPERQSGNGAPGPPSRPPPTLHSGRPRKVWKMKLTSKSVALLPIIATVVTAAIGATLIAAPVANAATTLGAAAQQSGRYFGTAVAANKLGDSRSEERR